MKGERDHSGDRMSDAGTVARCGYVTRCVDPIATDAAVLRNRKTGKAWSSRMADLVRQSCEVGEVTWPMRVVLAVAS
ncbi:MAG: hypothetical protein ABGZ53_10070 [Fuerstiella sp.]